MAAYNIIKLLRLGVKLPKRSFFMVLFCDKKILGLFKQWILSGGFCYRSLCNYFLCIALIEILFVEDSAYMIK